MGAVATDRSALGLHDDVRDAAPVIDPAIRLIHRVVALVELLDVGVEAVSVLHQELARAQDAEARARLVTELRLDLVERDGKLLVRANEVANDVRRHFFVRRPQRHVLIGADRELHEQVAIRLEPAGLLPELDRLKRRH